ncbi:MAG: hypothetical protein SFU85_13155 [Candidatus Methylacidiphilales bacterium]|nr:hypothetical protein [Candidatus Methylacidiphilales bacterium]
MKFLKALLACLLLPCFHALFSFAREIALAVDVSRVPWIPLAVFFLGMSAWCLVFFLFPRPTWFYVLGHEITHAVAVVASGGRVSGFKVRSDGGHVVADRTSCFIALSPYLIPFYPIVLGVIWALVVHFLPDWQRYTILFLPFWGASWGFHFTFTGSLLKSGQSDFESQGYFFSWVIILLGNLGFLVCMAYFWTQPFPLPEALALLARSLLNSYELCGQVLQDWKDMIN